VTFDMGGVADPAALNAPAWKETIDGLLRARNDLGGGRPVHVDCLDDTPDGTTGQGAHLGAMAGTVDVVLGVYGLSTRADTSWFEPRLPAGLPASRFTLLVRGQTDSGGADRRLRVTLALGGAASVRIVIDGVARNVNAGANRRLPDPAARTSRRGRFAPAAA